MLCNIKRKIPFFHSDSTWHAIAGELRFLKADPGVVGNNILPAVPGIRASNYLASEGGRIAQR